MTLPSSAESKPYKGPQSYQAEDAELFFGREREANQLIAKILSARLTLLHAQSGAGKTSLLNALVIPGLESRGWGAFRILPQNDPVLSARLATLSYTLPPPIAERHAIKRAIEGLPTVSEDSTIDQILACYDDLQPRDMAKRSLIAPLEVTGSISPKILAIFTSVTPIFCRLLRSSIEVEAFGEHLNAIKLQSGSPLFSGSLNGTIRIRELLDLISDPAFNIAYEDLIEDLNIPVNDLRAFFEQLVQGYGRRLTRFALVLVLDQFEELFTRFIDHGHAIPRKGFDLPDWRLRWEFFAHLEKLYGADYSPEETSVSSQTDTLIYQKSDLPLRFVISMRDEYIAHIDPIRRFAWNLDNDSYHLNLLDGEQATAAIKQPARLFGYSYAADCYAEILNQLTKEERFVEPAHLQLVCEKLWNERGRELASNSVGVDSLEQNKQIELNLFLALGGVRGILKSFFRDFLDRLENVDQLETLEMLELLVTSSGTRNIVEHSYLIRSTFRNTERRRYLLDNLTDRTIVRTERRLGGNFVEITHEFLIGPILEALRDILGKDTEYNRFRWAIRTIERLYADRDLDDPASRYLLSEEFRILHYQRDNIHWNQWGSELMLRSAINLGADMYTLRIWADRVDSFGSSSPQAP